MMEPAALVAMWRAAARPRELARALPELVDALAQMLPIDGIAVMRLDGESLSARCWPAELGRGAPQIEARAHTRSEIERVLAWCRAGGQVLLGPGEPAPLPLSWVLPRQAPRGRMMAALPGEPAGALVVLRARGGHALDEGHAALVAAMALEPLAAALAQDAIAGELGALRHAVARAERYVSRLHDEDRDGLSDYIIGADRGLRPVMERVSMVAHSDVPVLILGETGSGKEVLARAIHTRSPRAAGPFLRVNCGAIAPDLIDSELFGHEKGSFTGATATHRGWFERAHRGTLFLDEIGELSLPAQVRLLRVLQDGTLRRVGGESALAVDVRVVAATHRDLSAMVQRGSFREDLWYRLAVFPIDLPPLRAHPEDIPAMAAFFARRAATRFDLPLRLPTDRDLALLLAYAWPGNVRELGAVIDRAVLLGRGVRLEVAKALGQGHESAGDGEHGPGPLATRAIISAATPAIAPTVASAVTSPASSAAQPGQEIANLDMAIRAHIEKALRATHGCIEGPGGAARLLDVNPHTLRSRMRKLGIDWARFRGF